MSQWNFVIQHPDGSETRIYGDYYYQDYDGKWKYSPVPSTQEERLRLLRGRRNPNNNGMTYWFDCPLYVADTKDAVVAIVNANRPATPVPYFFLDIINQSLPLNAHFDDINWLCYDS